MSAFCQRNLRLVREETRRKPARRAFCRACVYWIVYARHGREPFGPELKAEGLMGCPFDLAQGKGSPLYACPVAMKGYRL